jgi:DNA-binding LacI/PurR family transcriptional regulator
MAEEVRRHSGLPGLMVRQGFNAGYSLLRWWNGFAALRPVLVHTYADPSITAWVCSDDSLAVLAHAFILEKGRVPGRELTLASFDNSRMPNMLGITSYDFGFDIMGRLAANCLTSPHLVTVDKNNTVRTSGQLVARASSGRAAGGGLPPTPSPGGSVSGGQDISLPSGLRR